MDSGKSITLQYLYNVLNDSLRDALSSLKGLTLTNLSFEKKQLGEGDLYRNFYYYNVIHNKFSASLRISKQCIDEYKVSVGNDISPNAAFDIVIDSLYMGKLMNLVINVQSIRESGLSDKEILHKRLASFCRKKKYFQRERKKLPYLITSVLALTSRSSDIEQDIVSNLHIAKNKIKIVRCATANIIADEIKKNSKYDMIVLYRGGFDDGAMRIFSSENIIDAIVHSNVPVASALGHEEDHPFICEITDMNYSTPSSFGVQVSQYNLKVKDKLENIECDIQDLLNNLMSKSLKYIDNAMNEINSQVSHLSEQKAAIVNETCKDTHHIVHRLSDQYLIKNNVLLGDITSICRDICLSYSSIENISSVSTYLCDKIVAELAVYHKDLEGCVGYTADLLIKFIENKLDEINYIYDENNQEIEKRKRKKFQAIGGVILLLVLSVIYFFYLK